MTFSFIVPVYNTAAYLPRCIQSLLPALRGGDEILLSLGHSRDDSEAIAMDLAAEHSAIRCLYQDATGLGDARNCAISQAQGDYVVCVDSDDYVMTDALGALLDRIRQEGWTEDLIFCDYYRQDGDAPPRPCFFFGERSDLCGAEHLPELLENRRNFCTVWRYLYKLSFLREHNICYLGQSMAEDVDYTTSVYLAGPSVRYTHSPYYVYTTGRGGSLMDTADFRRLEETVRVLTQSISRLRASALPHAGAMIAQLQYELILTSALLYELPRGQRRQALPLLEAAAALLLPTTDPRVLGCARAIRLLGPAPLAYALHTAKRARHLLRS